MADDLSLRRTVIGGETTAEDYQVIWDELAIYDQIKAARAIQDDRSRPWQR
jgi:hypothetical protein